MRVREYVVIALAASVTSCCLAPRESPVCAAGQSKGAYAQKAEADLPIDIFDYGGEDLRRSDETLRTRLVGFLRPRVEDYYRTNSPWPPGSFPEEMAASGNTFIWPPHIDPWYAWSVMMDDSVLGVRRWVVFEGVPLMVTTSCSGARIHLFETNGNHLATFIFSTGYRMDIMGARVLRDCFSPTSRPVIEVWTKPFLNGGRAARQFYALTRDRVFLLRIENSDGTLCRNSYWACNFTVGPRNAGTKEDEWVDLLNSERPWEQMEALVWIGGIHRVNTRGHSDMSDRTGASYESEAEVGMWASVVRRSDVRTRIAGLMKSETKWVREAAVAAEGGIGAALESGVCDEDRSER